MLKKSDFWDLNPLLFLCPGNLNFLLEVLNVLEIGIIDNDLMAS